MQVGRIPGLVRPLYIRPGSLGLRGQWRRRSGEAGKPVRWEAVRGMLWDEAKAFNAEGDLSPINSTRCGKSGRKDGRKTGLGALAQMLITFHD